MKLSVESKLNRLLRVLSLIFLGGAFAHTNKAWSLSSGTLNPRKLNVALSIPIKEQKGAKGDVIVSFSFPLVKGLKARFDAKEGLLIETADGRVFASAGLALALEGETAEESVARTLEVNTSLVEKLNAKLPELIAAKKYLSIKLYLVAGDNDDDAEVESEVTGLDFKEYVTDTLSRTVTYAVAQGKLQPTQSDVGQFMKAIAPQILQTLVEQNEDLEAADHDLDKFLEKSKARAQAKKNAPSLPKAAPQQKAPEEEKAQPKARVRNPYLTV